jgi:hypothetical protein
MKTQKGARAYSTLLACIYDEPEGLGDLGGHHYSIFRTVTTFNEAGSTFWQNVARLHHVAVIWDGDHDTRVIGVVEQLYLANLLRTIAFIGEHKGEVNVLFAPGFVRAVPPQQHQGYRKVISDIVANPVHGDSWTTQFGQFIPAGEEDAKFTTDTANLLGMKDGITYLNHIHNMWRLGVREFEASDSAWQPQPHNVFVPPPPPPGSTMPPMPPLPRR